MYGHISHPVVIIRSIRIVARSALEIVSISVCFMRFKRGRDVGTRRARFGGIVHVHPCVQQVYTELSLEINIKQETCRNRGGAPARARRLGDAVFAE